MAVNRIDKGRAFYLAMYEKDGAIWAANDHKGLWCDMAEDYERRLSTTPAVGGEAHSMLTEFAAECHRAKWQFDLSEDFQPSKSAARALILQAAHELHRIGDLAIKVRDAIAAQPHSLVSLIREYARDLRRNSSGGDDYPWEWAKATADYLEVLIGRAALASPPEQPSDTAVEMYSDALVAANKRIAELEDKLWKAASSGKETK